MFKKRIKQSTNPASGSGSGTNDNSSGGQSPEEALRLKRKGRRQRRKHLEAKLYVGNTNQRGPDFLVIGTQKGGTSALASFLREHPEVCMGGPRKELHYFDSSKLPPIEEYHRSFLVEPQHRVVGEATPSYMFMPRAIPRIHKYNPGLKLIVLLRDPIARSYSNWNMARMRLQWPEKFDVKEIMDAHLNGGDPKKGFILARSLYFEQIRRVFDHFPREQVLIMDSNDLKSKHEESLALVASFLEIGAFPTIENRSKHARDYPKPLGEADYLALKDFFQEDVDNLRLDFGIDTSSWMNKF